MVESICLGLLTDLQKLIHFLQADQIIILFLQYGSLAPQFAVGRFLPSSYGIQGQYFDCSRLTLIVDCSNRFPTRNESSLSIMVILNFVTICKYNDHRSHFAGFLNFR